VDGEDQKGGGGRKHKFPEIKGLVYSTGRLCELEVSTSFLGASRKKLLEVFVGLENLSYLLGDGGN